MLRETVVNPPTVTTPLILVFAWIPAVSATTAWPIKAFWLLKKISELAPFDAWVWSLAKYLVSAPLTDCTAGAKFWSPRKNVKEFAAPPVANLSVSITPDVISDAAIWLDDRDTQLLLFVEDVLTTLLMLIVFELSSSNVSVSSILILFTISPYNLLSIKTTPCACVPAPGGAAKLTDGCVV